MFKEYHIRQLVSPEVLARLVRGLGVEYHTCQLISLEKLVPGWCGAEYYTCPMVCLEELAR